VVAGRDFEFRDVTYETENIIPGVHHSDRSYHSLAIMGNIAYPIDVPNAEKNLGSLNQLLNCGLVMEFDIGELDFQASREGLSYIPQTIDSIKRKLEAVNAQLAVHIAQEADKIENLWERAMFLEQKASVSLWQSAVEKYIVDTDFKFFRVVANYRPQLENFKLNVEQIASRYNIQIRAFNKSRGYGTVSNASPDYDYDKVKKDANGHALRINSWRIPVSNGTRFVINDLKVGASERARNHFRKMDHARDMPYTFNVFVLEPVDKSKPMNTKALFRILRTPPAEYIMKASELMEKERASTGTGGTGRNVTIMRLEERGNGGYYRSQEYVWRDAGKADQFDSKNTYYYIPMKGYNIDSEVFKDMSGKSIHRMLNDSGIKSLQVEVYGVRKTDIEFIKTQKNWVNIETFIKKELSKVTDAQLKTLAMSMIDNQRLVRYNSKISSLVKPTSQYFIAAEKVKNSEKIDMSRHCLEQLCEAFKVTIDVQKHIDAIAKEHAEIYARYPLLGNLGYSADDASVAEYINAIDLMKK
jgi:hypothetical protein